MARPRIFVSSTHYDLKHIRASLDGFIESLGFEPVISEKGDIAYDPLLPLDESCYREAAGCDVLLLIIGGSYGSEASEDATTDLPPEFYDRYESITKKEYEAAVENDIPTYILIDKLVNGEYQTYRKNRDNQEIQYAHVDSINIFHLIDQILSRRRNNPVHHFEGYADIENWLKDQWAGLFGELLRQRSQQQQIGSLSSKINELGEVSQTLKRYLEEIVSKVSAGEASDLIEFETERLEESRRLAEFSETDLGQLLTSAFGLSKEEAASLVRRASSLESFAEEFAQLVPEGMKAEDYLLMLQDDPGTQETINKARGALGIQPLVFAGEPAA